MKNNLAKPLVIPLSLLALACTAKSADSAGLAPTTWTSAHWIAIRRVEGGSIPKRKPAEFQVWMKGDSALIGGGAGALDSVRILRVGSDAYSWHLGGTTGMKITSPESDERKLAVASVGYILQSAACRATGKRGTTGTYDGHPFVSYDCTVAADSTKRVYYYATDLQNFPVYALIMFADHTVIVYDSKALEVPATFSDSLLMVPAGVQFAPGPAM
jgi:hypothetical protein